MTLTSYFLLALKKTHAPFFLIFAVFDTLNKASVVRASLKSHPFSMFLYSSMISTFEYKCPLGATFLPSSQPL